MSKLSNISVLLGVGCGTIEDGALLVVLTRKPSNLDNMLLLLLQCVGQGPNGALHVILTSKPSNIHIHNFEICVLTSNCCSAWNKVEMEHYKFQDTLKQTRSNLKQELTEVCCVCVRVCVCVCVWVCVCVCVCV
jgi:hypothetical protein